MSEQEMSHMTIESIEDVNFNMPVTIDLDELINSKMLIHAASGGGKSYLIRKMVEDIITKYGNKLQVILVSPKREYESLKNILQMAIVGHPRTGFAVDIEADPAKAHEIALKILETKTHAYIEFSGMPNSADNFLNNFIRSLNTVPEKLFHPLLIIIDEAHKYAPQFDKKQSMSLPAIIDLAATGRDKGFALICATQRLAKLNKNIVSELNTKLMGMCTYSNDINRSLEELGIKKTPSTPFALLGEPNYYFYAKGPAISNQIIKVISKKPTTEHIVGWKKYQSNEYNTHVPIAIISEQLNQYQPVQQNLELKTKKECLKKIKQLEEMLKSKNTPEELKLEGKRLAHEEIQPFVDAIISTFQKEIDELYKVLKKHASMISQIHEHKDIGEYIDEYFKNTNRVLEIKNTSNRTLDLNYNNILNRIEKDKSLPITFAGIEKISYKKEQYILDVLFQFYPNYLTTTELAVLSLHTPISGDIINLITILLKQGKITSHNNTLRVTHIEYLKVPTCDRKTLNLSSKNIIEQNAENIGGKTAKLLLYLHAHKDKYHTRDNLIDILQFPTMPSLIESASRLHNLGLITIYNNTIQLSQHVQKGDKL